MQQERRSQLSSNSFTLCRGVWHTKWASILTVASSQSIESGQSDVLSGKHVIEIVVFAIFMGILQLFVHN